MIDVLVWENKIVQYEYQVPSYAKYQYQIYKLHIEINIVKKNITILTNPCHNIIVAQEIDAIYITVENIEITQKYQKTISKFRKKVSYS